MNSILFVGNSFTYVNDLPAMFEYICNAAGHTLTADRVVKGGWYLSRYADPENEMGVILRQEYPKKVWDVIVWQDQSFNPARNTPDFLAASQALCREFPARGKAAFYQTWAYEDNTDKLASTGLTYDEMHAQLKAAYQQAADENGAVCVPVGDAFSRCYKTHPEISLYWPDHFHPSESGTYLAACTFYAFLYNQSPLDLTVPENVDPALAPTLRRIAHDVWQNNK